MWRTECFCSAATRKRRRDERGLIDILVAHWQTNQKWEPVPLLCRCGKSSLPFIFQSLLKEEGSNGLITKN
jgi:hypothetical protein